MTMGWDYIVPPIQKEEIYLKLYHFLHRDVYDILLKQGYLNCNKEHLWCLKDWDDEDGNFYQAYLWMIDRMNKWLPPKPALAGEFPIWAWLKWGERYINGPLFEDLMTLKLSDKKSFISEEAFIENYLDHANTVKLTLDVPDELVLLTSHDIWHRPLNNSYLHPTPVDEDIYWENYDKGIRINYTKEEKWASWDSPRHVIAKQDVNMIPYRRGHGIQATFWLLTLDMVKDVRYRNQQVVTWDYEKGEPHYGR